jgi:hypothetical protein
VNSAFCFTAVSTILAGEQQQLNVLSIQITDRCSSSLRRVDRQQTPDQREASVKLFDVKSRLALVVIASAFSGCTTTTQFAAIGFEPPEWDYRLIVMQPDISFGVLTAGGMVEPNEEWTDQARENILEALIAQQSERGGFTKIAETLSDTGADEALVADLYWLHQAVGTSIRIHKYVGIRLPTKLNKFDWTLGDKAVEFGRVTGYDYALFLHAEDTVFSGGRVALAVAGLLGCAVGVCVMPPGGQYMSFASLVDLKTGQVIWYNTLVSSVGDMRTPEGAEKLVTTLLANMKPGRDVVAAGS